MKYIYKYTAITTFRILVQRNQRSQKPIHQDQTANSRVGETSSGRDNEQGQILDSHFWTDLGIIYISVHEVSNICESMILTISHPGRRADCHL